MSGAGFLSRSVGLVGCGKHKLDHSAPARELYTGPLFRAAATYAEATYDEWWVLSALHGLLHPNCVIAPYDDTLTDQPLERVTQWAHWVNLDLLCGPFLGAPNRAGLEQRMEAGRHVHLYLHAGKTYRDPLLPHLDEWPNATIHVPLAGLKVGEQLAWYAEHLSVEELV